jgi:glycosyltransferase involved in cell wall biosynthesis
VPYLVQPNGTARSIEQRRAAKVLFDRLFERRLLDRAAAVIAVSDWERGRLEASGLDRSLIHVVPNPLAPAPSLPARGTFRSRLGLTAEPLVLFLGALSPRKHPAVLARAVAAVEKPAQLVFAGNDRGAGAATRGEVRRLGIAGRTRFAGLLTGDERFAALADADVVVYASRDEAFGLAALEALQAGTPVIVGNDAGCGEVVTEVGGGMTVPPGDCPSLTAALDEVLRRLPEWKEAARLAGAAAQARFHPDPVWARLEPVYRAVSGRERPSS